jgi:hypothetical protein
VGLLFAVCITSSCSNEIDINVASDPVPVVYCLLNPDVSEQYVRLGRSYLTDPLKPDEPPITDSTVWNLPVEVYIEEWRDGVPVNTFRFDPVTAPAKDSGYFPADNLRLYKAGFIPKRLTEYHIYVHFPDDYRIVTGITEIPGKPDVYDPLDMPGRKINLQTGVQYTLRWAPGEGRGIFQGQFEFVYVEEVGTVSSLNQVILKLDPILALGEPIEITDIISGNRFLNEMVKQVPFREAAQRNVVNVRFRLFKGGEELALQVSPELQQTTLSGSLNEYTNLVNGIGLFSSVQQMSVNNLVLSNTTLNELAHSELTQALGFKDIHGGDLNLMNDE